MPISLNLKRFFALLVLGGLFLLAGPAAQAQAQGRAIGQVMSLTPGAFVTKAGRTDLEPLALKSPVYATDVVRTDTTGRVHILFNDDSAISLGPYTSIHLQEYADSGKKPVFNVFLGTGLARIITGKITEANPAGFKASTPEAVIGIRGTIVSLRVGKGETRVFVENTLRQVVANGISVPSGFKMHIAPGVAPTPVPIQPQDRRELGQDLAFLGGAGVAAASAEASQASAQPAGNGQILTAAGTAGPVIENTLLTARNTLSTQTLGDSLRPPFVPTTGEVRGSFSKGNFSSGNYSFDVNLSNGLISNGIINASGVGISNDPYSFNLTGGTGSVGFAGFPTSFQMDAYGPGTRNGINSEVYASISDLNIDLREVPSGASFDVSYYSAYLGPIGIYYTLDQGGGIGTITHK